MSGRSKTLYSHPFSRAYWRDACREIRDVRMLVFAALMLALRLALKTVKIPIGPSLNINVQFFVTALGAMVCGPVLAAFSGVLSDTLGYLIAPSGVYFPGFILTEAAGGLVFALVLYRAKLTPGRVILSRFCVNFFVNIILQTPIMVLYYRVAMGKGYAWFDLPRIVKNLMLFPFESVLLILFLGAAVPALSRLGMTGSGAEKMKINGQVILQLAGLTLLSAGAVQLYFYWMRDKFLDKLPESLLASPAVGIALAAAGAVCAAVAFGLRKR
ncbi:MAG: folate family ECF transporter S component [Clostridia bacterium]|nr:folate family ECF transporter S component [Clostridia bacterium]